MSVEKYDFESIRKEDMPTGYTQLPNFVLQNFTRESIKYWVYLQSHSSNWRGNRVHLQRIFKDGRDKAKRLLKELHDFQLIGYEQVKNENGEFGKSQMVVKNGIDYYNKFVQPTAVLKTSIAAEIHRSTENPFNGKPVPHTKEIILPNENNKPLLLRESKKSTLTIELPNWLPRKDWEDFVEHRRHIKAPLSQNAAERAIKTLESLKYKGHLPHQVIDQTIVNGYRGLFAPSENRQKGSHHGKPKSKSQIHFDSVKGSLKGTKYDPECNPEIGKKFVYNADLDPFSSKNR